MSEHLPDVQLTDAQAARAELIWRQLTTMAALSQAARLIVHLQDEVEFKAGLIAGYEHRVAELEHKIDTCGMECSVTIKRLMAENQSLREGDRRARAIEKLKNPAHEREGPHCSTCSCGMPTETTGDGR